MSDSKSPANLRTLKALHREGLLNENALAAAGDLLERETDWPTWARRVLLTYGATLAIIGVIYFFAYNWREMHKFLKFGVIESALLGCVFFAWRRGFENLSGKILLTTASVLIGVLLAVFGQTYQTGADPYELFLGWAALSFGFVILSRFSALWILWFVLINTAAILCWSQVAGPAHEIGYAILCLLLAAINGTALALRELCAVKQISWLPETALRHIFLVAALVPLTVPAIDFVADMGDAPGDVIGVAFIWTIASGYVYWLYRRRFRDVSVLAIITLGVTIVSLVFIGNVLAGAIDDGTGCFLAFSIIVLGFTTASVLLLKRESNQLLAA